MNKDAEVKKKPQSLAYKTWIVLMIAIIVSVAWHTVDWMRMGYSQMYLNLDKQITLFARDIIQRQPFLLKEYLLIENSFEENTESITSPILIQEEKVANTYTVKGNKFKESAAKIGIFFREAWNVAKLSFLLVCIKFISIFSSFLLFIFSGLLGALDGLRRRYIRTMEAGRESTYLYHNISSLFRQIPALLVLVYLLVPVSIPATLVIVLISAGLFVYCDLFFSTLKKFL